MYLLSQKIKKRANPDNTEDVDYFSVDWLTQKLIVSLSLFCIFSFLESRSLCELTRLLCLLLALCRGSVCGEVKGVLTKQRSRWADTLVTDRSTPELQRRSKASESHESAPTTSPLPPPSSPGQTAGGHRPGNKDDNCCHCHEQGCGSLKGMFNTDWMTVTYRPCSIAKIYL